jgi:hypothetical protein
MVTVVRISLNLAIWTWIRKDCFNSIYSNNDNLVSLNFFRYFAAIFSADRNQRLFINLVDVCYVDNNGLSTSAFCLD